MTVKLQNKRDIKIISAARIISITSPDSAPAKRIIQEASEKSRLVDASHGRRTLAVIVMDSMHVVLSALQPETVAGRINAESEE